MSSRSDLGGSEPTTETVAPGVESVPSESDAPTESVSDEMVTNANQSDLVSSEPTAETVAPEEESVPSEPDTLAESISEEAITSAEPTTESPTELEIEDTNDNAEGASE